MADHLSSPPVLLLDFSLVVFNTGRSLVANRVNRRMGCPRISQQKAEPRYQSDQTHFQCDTLIDAIDPQAIWVSREVVTNGSESLCVRSGSLSMFCRATSNPPWPSPISCSIYYTSGNFTSSIDLYPIGSAFVAEVRTNHNLSA
jgi:hypothetical protein